MHDVVRAQRFVFLLCALTALLVAAPIVRAYGPGSYPRLAGVAFAGFFVVMLVSAVFAASRETTSQVVALALAVPAIVLQGLHSWYETPWLGIAAHAIEISFLVFVVSLILRFMFRTDRVTSDMICASLCVYLLLGVLWAIAYSLLQLADPRSFALPAANSGDAEVMRFGGDRTLIALYYSFVTMSTLGYGDIVPRSSLARMTAAIQAIVGQLYLVVLVARLVGLHVAQGKDRQAATADER